MDHSRLAPLVGFVYGCNYVHLVSHISIRIVAVWLRETIDNRSLTVSGLFSVFIYNMTSLYLSMAIDSIYLWYGVADPFMRRPPEK